MSVVLSSFDLRQLAVAIELLVSPADHDTLDGWRRAVNRQLGGMLGADSMGFMMPVVDGLYLFSEEHDPAELAKYPGLLPPPMRDGTPLWTRFLQLGTGTLAQTYGRDFDLYTGGAYYNEFAAPNGAHDTLMTAFALDGLHEWACGELPPIAALQFWHQDPAGRKFGAREVALLGAVLPAFRAGVQAALAIGGERRRTLELIDRLGDAALVTDRCGGLAHETPALAELLDRDPERDAIRNALRDLARRAAVSLRGGGDPQPAAFDSVIRTALAGYRAAVTLHHGDGRRLIIVRVVRTTPLPMTGPEMVREFGLTAAESRVAELISRGASNAQISSTLFISVHTARRHTERILAKLGVASRAGVVGKVLR